MEKTDQLLGVTGERSVFFEDVTKGREDAFFERDIDQIVGL